MGRIRGRFFLWCSSVTAGELLEGCRSKSERRAVSELVSSFGSRVVAPLHADCVRAGDALSKLRQTGRTLKGAALLDGLQAASACRIGALLVTHNLSDFRMLQAYIPVRVQSFDDFRERLWSKL